MKNYFYSLFVFAMLVFMTAIPVLASDFAQTEVSFVMGAPPSIVTMEPPQIAYEISYHYAETQEQFRPEPRPREDFLIRPAWQSESALASIIKYRRMQVKENIKS